MFAISSYVSHQHWQWIVESKIVDVPAKLHKKAQRNRQKTCIQPQKKQVYFLAAKSDLRREPKVRGQWDQ